MRHPKKNIEVKTDEIILLDPMKLANHALRHECEIVHIEDGYNTLKIYRKDNKQMFYHIMRGSKISLQQAQFACLRSLNIPLMSEIDWQD